MGNPRLAQASQQPRPVLPKVHVKLGYQQIPDCPGIPETAGSRFNAIRIGDLRT
jgi:hypothetical protein